MSGVQISQNSGDPVDIANYLTRYMEENEGEEEEKEEANGNDVYTELQQRERELILAAELGKALLASNDELKQKNELLVEEFQQKIYELEREKQTLKIKLEVVENDYDYQIKELQSDIVHLREDLKRQRSTNQEGERERVNLIRDLSQQNDQLSERLRDSAANEKLLGHQLTDLQQQMRSKRTSMHEHLLQLEVLRDEISNLHEEKDELERRLLTLTAERDLLLGTLEDSQTRVRLMERQNREQETTIICQEQEILQLQETAAVLQERLEHLSLQSKQRQNQQQRHEAAGASWSVEAGMTVAGEGPHHSLLAELATSMETANQNGAAGVSDDAGGGMARIQARPTNLWWSRRGQFGGSCCQQGEDDLGYDLDIDGQEEEEENVEMDDASVLACVAAAATSRDQGHHRSRQVLDLYLSPSLMSAEREDEGIAGVLSGAAGSSDSEELDFLHELRAEVLEVYQQLRLMCAELSARHRHPGSAPGITPDELALVEMDFRLGSLRDVLGELKALLHDLVSLRPNSTGLMMIGQNGTNEVHSGAAASGHATSVTSGSGVDNNRCGIIEDLERQLADRDAEFRRWSEELYLLDEQLRANVTNTACEKATLPNGYQEEEEEEEEDDEESDEAVVMKARRARDQALLRRDEMQRELERAQADLDRIRGELRSAAGNSNMTAASHRQFMVDQLQIFEDDEDYEFE